MRLILAGNAEQAKSVYCSGDKYLAILPNDLFGHSDCNLAAVGTFYMRPDYNQNEIYYYCKSHNITLPEWLETRLA